MNTKKASLFKMEPLADPIWSSRVERLLDVLTEPLTPIEVIRRARKQLGFSSTLTTHTLAVAENHQIYYRSGKWWRF